MLRSTPSRAPGRRMPLRAVARSLLAVATAPRHPLLGLALLSPLASAGMPALAGEAVTASQATELDAVRVQAERARLDGGALGSRTLLDTPFSVVAVDAEQLETRQVNALGHAFAGDASVNAVGNRYGMWASMLNVRGLQLDFGNSYKLDGMPFYSFGVELPIELFEQVQLLKGASGFLYGFGAPGGIVDYVSKRPTEQPYLAVDIGYRSDSLFSEHLDAGGRFGAEDRYGYRINASNEQGDVYYGGHLQRQAASAALEARLGERVTWTADLLYQRRQIDRLMPYFSVTSFVGERLLPAIDGGRELAADAAFGDTRTGSARSGLRWDINAQWQARLDYAWLRTDQRFDQEYFYVGNAAGDYGDFTFVGHNVNRFSTVQALLEGRVDTGPLRHQLVFGASGQWQRVWANALSAWGLAAGGNLYDDFGRLRWQPSNQLAQYRSADYRQQALFASDTIALTSRWSLLAGARYTDYQQRSYADDDGALVSEYRQSPITPTAALLFKPRADTTLYASYVESLEQGSTVSANYANRNAVLPPLKSKQSELGAKVERAQWSANAALFRIERGATYVTADNRFVQDGMIRYQGLELEGQLRPADGWNLGGSVLLLDAEHQRTSAALAGKRPGGVARRSAALQLAHTPSAMPALDLHLDARYTGPMTLLAGRALQAPGYTVFNAGAGWRTTLGAHPLTLRAEVLNLFDRRYWQGGNFTIQPGEPRTLALNAKLEL